MRQGDLRIWPYLNYPAAAGELNNSGQHTPLCAIGATCDSSCLHPLATPTPASEDHLLHSVTIPACQLLPSREPYQAADQCLLRLHQV